MNNLKLSVVSTADRNTFPTLSQLRENDVENIWASISSFIERQMSLQKGVHVPGLGTFSFSQQKLDLGKKYLLIQRPIFLLSEKLVYLYRLKQVKQMAAGEVPVVPLNFMALAVGSPFVWDQVAGCARETLQLLVHAVLAQNGVVFTLRGIGVLSFCEDKVKMKFYKDFIMAMDATGHLLWALSNRPGNSSSLLPERLSSQQKAHTRDTIQLPSLLHVEQSGRPLTKQEMEVPHTEEKIRKYWWNTETPSALLPRTPQMVSQVSECSVREEWNTSAPTVTRKRSIITVQPPPDKIFAPEGRTESVHPDLTCPDHNRAGQELCYLCMQRTQCNVPIFLGEEHLKEEQKKEMMLLLNEQEKVQEFLQKERANKEVVQMNNQKVAAFNLGVADAMGKEKTSQFTECHGSYLFTGRPITTPHLPQQQQYMQELQAQIKTCHTLQTCSQQNHELLGCLQQVQLTDQMMEQRLQQIHNKAENVTSYQKVQENQARKNMKPDRKEMLRHIYATSLPAGLAMQRPAKAMPL